MRQLASLALAVLLGCQESIPEQRALPPPDAPDTTVDIECTTGVPLWGTYGIDCGGGVAGSCIDAIYARALTGADEGTREFLANCGNDAAAVSVCGDAPALAPLMLSEDTGGPVCVLCSVWLPYAESADAVRAWAKCLTERCPHGACS